MGIGTQGRLIVIEGGDGLGKSTQFNLIKNILNEAGYTVSTFDFPHKSDTPIGKLIGSFLNGQFGSVEPEFLSLAFAADRYSAKESIEHKLKNKHIVLCDRFILSNIAFQASKIVDTQRKENLINLISWLEYDVYKLPEPDLEIIITAPNSHFVDGVYLDRENSKDRGYLAQNSDIHELDESLQVNVNNFFRNLENRSNRVFIDAYDPIGARKSINDINIEIMDFVNKTL